ncbi:hypothetical protein UA08_01343 [Talaromyces atroroseus]|uniref:Uncharacterized protein n=1 Tax=Talaromyces atroroseus TaxID=1441469 RepID=A0A1Q5Q9S0_TALAT|nr:hypothetical protein UA08_01343 [Talaromyces atroroseus]OKL62676.1 hypothetical protein UA08_01343 [Talaromyces atroroseus]
MYKRIPLDGQIRDLLSLISLANGKLAEEDLTMSQANLPIVGNEEGPSLLEELQEMKQSISTLAQKASTSEQSILILNQSNSVLEQKISVLDNSNSALSERIMHLHQEEMLGHVAELESFLPDNDPWSDDRVARNLAVHGGDFRKSEEALRYIEEHDVTRLKGAVEGFRRRYGISRTDYHDFQLATGPDEVIHALNKKSDVAHFTLLKRCNGSSRKAATEVCDSIISAASLK